MHVASFAVPGATSAWGLRQTDAIIAFRPDFILLEFAVNDAALHRRISAGASADTIAAIVDRLATALPTSRIAVMAMNPVHGLRAAARPLLDHYVEAHARAADEGGADFIDHRPAWRAHTRAQRRLMIPDGVHPITACAVTLMLPTLMKRLAPAPAPAKEQAYAG